MTFHAGQKVVCVDDSAGICSPTGKRILVVNKIYIIERVHLPYLTLVGVSLDQPYARGWFATRFRPLIERKTDISVFTAMLNRKTKTEPVA